LRRGGRRGDVEKHGESPTGDAARHNDTVDALATLRVVRAVLAADLACDETDFLGDGVRIALAEERPGRRRSWRGRRPLLIATMGAGAVVSCDASRLEWARAEFDGLDRNRLFMATALARIAARVDADGQALAGPDLKFTCADEHLQPAAAPAGISIDVVDGLAVAALYRQHEFRHALSYLTGSPRPDLVAAVARTHQEDGSRAASTGRIVGVAGAIADCETLWHIGVDVVEGERGRGVGRAMVGRLTAEVLAWGCVPYYSTTVSNLRSSRLALGLGYRLAWVELHTEEPQEP
jgi:GNAT superfamily N-acetyltransferase